MRSLLIITSFLLLFVSATTAQSVAINNNGAQANGSAILDVSSTTKGFLIPRMTGAQRLAIANPTAGLQVFQTDDIVNNPAGFYFFNGNAWILSFNLVGTNNTTGWALGGNANTNPATHYVGTSNTVDLRLATNNATRMTIKSTGEIGIGNSNPAAILGMTRGNINTNQPILRIDDGSSTATSPSVLLFNNGSNSLINGGTLGNGIMLNLSRQGSATASAEGIKVTNIGSGAAISADNVNGVGAGINASSGAGDGGVFTSVTKAGIVANGRTGAVINSTGDGDGISLSMNSSKSSNTPLNGLNIAMNTTGSSLVIGATIAPKSSTNGQFVLGIFSKPIGFGTTAVSCFQGEGDMFVSGDVFAASDRKLKKNIMPEKNALSSIMKLAPSTYHFRTDEFDLNLSRQKEHGLIAQELQEVFPELVAEQTLPPTVDDKTNEVIKPSAKLLSVNYIGLIPILVSGMQEQQLKIQALEKENEQLKKDIAAIKAKLGL